MNKKLILFGAAFAALATFTGCSSDEPLADVQQPQLQESDSVEVVEQGTPMTVFLGSGSSRADLNKKVGDLQSFKLWAVQQTDPKVRWLDGAVFKGNNTDGWTATGAVWPTTQKTTASKFYGYADFSDLTGTDVPGIAPTIGANSQSFTYTLGDGEESTLSNEHGYTEMNELMKLETGEDDAEMLVLIEACKKTEQAYVVEDKNTLPDLLVTANDQEGTEGDDGKFSLNLKHALSNLVIKAKFVADNDKWVDGMEFYIEWIRIHGLYTSGTYTFGDGNGWTFDSNTDKKIVYEKFFGMGDDNAKKVTIQSSASAATSVNYTTLISLGEFMMIPQSFTSWTSTGIQGTATAPEGVYIEFAGYLKNGAAESWDGQSHFLPLSVTNTTFVAGKSHTLVVDLTYSMDDHGVYDATPAEVGGGARMASYFEE